MWNFSKLVCVFLVSSNAFGMGAPKTDLPQFLEVVKNEIYRGGHPSVTGLKNLAQSKIKTVLDLENNLDAPLEAEASQVKNLGMTFISVPLSGISSPSKADMNYIQSVLKDQTAYPIYVHCKYGSDRTGLVIGLYRVFGQNWTPQEAYEEMEQHGFHRVLFGLTLYFKDATGYDIIRYESKERCEATSLP